MLSEISNALTGKHRVRSLLDINYLVIHRTIGNTAVESIAEFKKVGKFEAGSYTGGIYPYHFFLPYYGDPVQCLPLGRVGPAALQKLNNEGIHIALAGDLRVKPPSDGQVVKLHQLCASIQAAFNYRLKIIGHTEDEELANLKGSMDPTKVCPGKMLNLNALRRYVEDTYLNSIKGRLDMAHING